MRNRGWPAVLLLAALAMAGAAQAQSQQSQQGRLTGLQLSGDQPIQIESDRLEVRDDENIAIFSGNVAVSQGDTVMRAGNMTVHYSGNAAPGAGGAADIERLEVGGGVHVRSRDQVATGDRGTFDMRAEVLVLTGDEVILRDGENVIMGCRLTVEMASGRARLDGCADSGRVRMLLQPGSQNR